MHSNCLWPWQVTKEVQASERVLLECQQIIRNMSSKTEIDNTQPKQVSSLLDRVKARMTPSLLELYGQNWDVEASEGMECLEKLRAHETTLTPMVPFIRAWHDSKTSGPDLLQLAKACKSDLYEPPSCVSMKALTRDLEQALIDEHFGHIVALLLKQEAGSKEDGVLQIENAQERCQFVERELIKVIVSLLRKPEKAGSVLSVLNNIFACEAGWEQHLPADGALVKELEVLKQLLSPMDTTLTQESYFVNFCV